MFLPALAEGGGGIDCPATSGDYNYVEGTANYETNPFEEGQLGVLFCEYENLSGEEGIEPFGEITAIFHIPGELSQELIDEYGCGKILGEQFSPTYVSSKTHFSSVAFSTPPLLDAASDIMGQIEEQNLATTCAELTSQEGSSTAESVKETIEEHEEIEDSAIEISSEEINEETIELIKEQIEKSQKIDIPEIKITKTPEVVLPDWIKNNAGWWAADQISDVDFSSGIEFMIKEKFIVLPATEAAAEKSDEIPGWVKNNAGWWADGSISDVDFVNGLQFLISNGIINVA